jgi:ubiquinone/menaquinone biosynthesis C-methylase UbiE
MVVSEAAHWDTIHQKSHRGTESHSQYAQEKEKLFSRGSLVVDLGSGSGSDAMYFAKNGHSVILLDISAFALQKAKERAVREGLADKIATRQIDFGLHDLPVKTSSVDIVYSRISLHYFESSHTAKLFRDIYRMLKSGGTAYLTFKSPKDEVEMNYLTNRATRFEDNVFIENNQLRSRFTPAQLQNILTKAGIESATVNEIEETIMGADNAPVGTLHLNEVIITKPSS